MGDRGAEYACVRTRGCRAICAMGANVVVCACECLYARAMREGVVGWMDDASIRDARSRAIGSGVDRGR